MGIPGLLKEIGKGDRIALAKLAVEHFEKTKRPLRIAIDAAIWNFQHQAGQGGKNPELRTLFFRLLKLLALPIHPVFVYDGKHKPLTKRGKTVSRYGTCIPNELSKNLVARFQFPHHTAPGEAEAECAFLQKHGIVDAVMSQDADAIMFGSTLTLRNWSKEGTRGNKTPTHVNVLSATKIKEASGLDAAGMILVAMLSGGDYHDGLPGFGPTLSCAIARAGFGAEMLRLVESGDELGLSSWRERLQYELHTNESGYFGRKNKTLVIPNDFPDLQILSYYSSPSISTVDKIPKLEERWVQWWEKEIDIKALRDYCAMTFDWLYKGGARRFIRCFAQPLFQDHLRRGKVAQEGHNSDEITEQRQHFVSGGIPELRFAAVPLDVVGIDLNEEEENPEFADLDEDEANADIENVESIDASEDRTLEEPSSPAKTRKRPPWNPTSAEKWWIPETILRLGLPDIVEEWHRHQQEIRADPVKFATRKCPKPKTNSKVLDASMKSGALDNFFVVTKPAGAVPSTPTKPKPQARSKIRKTPPKQLAFFSSSPDSPRIKDYFRATQIATTIRESGEAQSKTVREAAATTYTLKADAIVIDSSPPSSGAPLAVETTVTEDYDATLPASVTTRRRKVLRNIPKISQDEPNVGPVNSAIADNTKLRMRLADIKTKTSTLSRDSLPGSWKEVFGLESGGRRVSVVDLRAE